MMNDQWETVSEEGRLKLMYGSMFFLITITCVYTTQKYGCRVSIYCSIAVYGGPDVPLPVDVITVKRCTCLVYGGQGCAGRKLV